MTDTKINEKMLQGIVYDIFTSSSVGANCISSFLKGNVFDNLCIGVKYLLFQSEALARENKLLRKMLSDANIIIPSKETLMRCIKTCPYCGEPLNTLLAKQCFCCHMDWHDPENIIKHRVDKNKKKNNKDDDDDENVRRALGLD